MTHLTELIFSARQAHVAPWYWYRKLRATQLAGKSSRPKVAYNRLSAWLQRSPGQSRSRRALRLAEWSGCEPSNGSLLTAVGIR